MGPIIAEWPSGAFPEGVGHSVGRERKNKKEKKTSESDKAPLTGSLLTRKQFFKRGVAKQQCRQAGRGSFLGRRRSAQKGMGGGEG